MDILKLFQYNQKLKFSDIEKALRTRSNKLACHLKNLTKKGILIKEGSFYSLSENSEHLIPYLSEKSSPLAVVLILVGDRKKCFLITRSKRPFKGKLSLPGGRILIGESIEQATERIAGKFDIRAKFTKINSISLEHVKKNEKILHSFFLILVSARTNEKISLTDIKSNKKKIIPSDYKLITSNKKEISIKTFYTPA